MASYRGVNIRVCLICSAIGFCANNSPIVSTAPKAVYCLNYTKTQAIELLPKQKEKGFRETARYGKLSKSLYLWGF